MRSAASQALCRTIASEAPLSTKSQGSPRAISSRCVAGFLVGFATIWLATVGLNAEGDPYADFYFLTGWRMPRIWTLDEYADIKFKTRLVRDAGPDGVDAAIFGSSRVMRIDPAGGSFPEFAPRTLNLGVQGARLGIIIDFVEFTLRRHPRCVPLVGLDFFAFDSGPPSRSIYLNEEDPLPAWRAAYNHLSTYRTTPDAWKILRGQPAANRLLGNGLAVKAPPSPAKLHEMLNTFAASGWKDWALFRSSRYDSAKISLLRDLRARHPQTVFFVNPTSRWYQEGESQAGLRGDYERWIADLATFGNVLDFASCAEIVDDESNYLDPHHYNSKAGALILADVKAFKRGAPLRHARLLGSHGTN